MSNDSNKKETGGRKLRCLNTWWGYGRVCRSILFLILIIFFRSIVLNPKKLYSDTGKSLANNAFPVGSVEEEHCFKLASQQIGTMKLLNKIKTVLEVARRTTPYLSGDFVEAGVAAGGSSLLVLFYLACSGHLGEREFHLFDTWEGLPAPDVEQDRGFKKGAYLRTIDVLHNNIETWGKYYQDSADSEQRPTSFVYSWDDAKSRLKTHVGLFADTMPGVLASRSVAALYCDGDMYQSSMDCLTAAESRIQDEGWIYHDDYYTFLGNYQAVNDWIQKGTHFHESMQIVPQKGPWRPFTNLTKCSLPKDNSARSGTCGGRKAEACFWQVKII